jgi:hypothetical protein
MFTIVTARFNNDTWLENKIYRERHDFKCIYAPPSRLTDSIDLNSSVFVIEMNNSTNEILGIGLIKNKLVTDRTYKVYEDTNLNRYVYIGEHYISRELLNGYDPILVSILDKILFKGYTHSKRGSGLIKIPEKVLKLDICKDTDIKNTIKNIFLRHYKDKDKDNP